MIREYEVVYDRHKSDLIYPTRPLEKQFVYCYGHLFCCRVSASIPPKIRLDPELHQVLVPMVSPVPFSTVHVQIKRLLKFANRFKVGWSANLLKESRITQLVDHT